MTGFASVVVEAADHRIVWELRSVNHRFLDVSLRLPEEFRRLEADCRQAVASRIRRGKVDASLKIAPVEQAQSAPVLDEATAERVAALQNTLHARFPDAVPLSVAELARWPGLVAEPERPAAALDGVVTDALGEAVAALADARAAEGESIGALLEQRLAAIDALVRQLRPLCAGMPERQALRLKERLGRLEVDVEPGRLEQELALAAQRLDVSEELDRLESHTASIRAALVLDEPVGRKLDFVIQELNREANTLTSKAPDDDVTRLAVELKVLIEQMREQVQNVE